MSSGAAGRTFIPSARAARAAELQRAVRGSCARATAPRTLRSQLAFSVALITISGTALSALEIGQLALENATFSSNSF